MDFLKLPWDYGNLVTQVMNCIILALAFKVRSDIKLVFISIFNVLDLEVKAIG